MKIPNVDFDDMNVEAKSLASAMKRYGMVSITNIPNFESIREHALMASAKCAIMASETRPTHTFADGTVRKTLASYTIPNGMQRIPNAEKCDESFVPLSDKLRTTVSDIVAAFSKALTSELLMAATPILRTNTGHEFNTLHDVVENGEHLEHFHSYQKVPTESTPKEDTIELHKDQGLMIAFTPGVLVDPASGRIKDDESTFEATFANGETGQINFDPNSVVIMLGDGVDQFINRDDSSETLHAVPHALRVAPSTMWRSWYGRMILAPGDALHSSGLTYSELRQRMIETSLNSEASDTAPLGLACTTDMHANQRELASCAEGTIYCWHRCMSLEQYGAVQCSAQHPSYEAKCVNPREQLYAGGHGDYYPMCTNTTEPVSDYPRLPSAPRSETQCAMSEWLAYVNSRKTFYDHSVPLGNHSGYLLWSVIGDKNPTCTASGVTPDGTDVCDLSNRGVPMDTSTGTGTKRAKIEVLSNGLFGWVSLGFRWPGGAHMGMNGAPILMGLPYGGQDVAYTAKQGLDLGKGSSVRAFQIAERGSAFRHWKTPLSDTQSLFGVATSQTECFSSMQVETEGIMGIPFNFEGTDTMIWAMNKVDYFVGYHGRDNRGLIDITWQSGDAKEFDRYPPPPAPHPPPVYPPGTLVPEHIGAIAGAAAALLLLPVATIAWIRRKRRAHEVGVQNMQEDGANAQVVST